MKRATRGKLALAVVLLAGFVLLFAEPRSDERAARTAFERLAHSLDHRSDEAPDAREARIKRELGALLTSDVRVTLPGGESIAGRDAVIAKAVELGRGRRPVLSFKELRTGRQGKAHVRVAFEVIVSDSQAGDLHAAPRDGDADMVRGDQGYRLERLEVGRETRTEPEPRP